MSSLDLGVIGNCSFGALIDGKARINWCCLPRFDGDPVFSSLLNNDSPDAGFFDIELIDLDRTEQAYVRNSAVLRTVLYDRRGGAIEIVDFAPRFRSLGRIFRPNMIIRMVRTLAGTPRIRVRLRPTFDYNTEKPTVTRGSNHVSYVSTAMTFRVTTDMPISYLITETAFLLEEEIALILGPDESLGESVGHTARTFREQTLHYWQEWARALRIPFEWQSAVIRAAITLKLCSYEETGAIIAALTTSIPEFANSGRNWDYRFCWLRDAYFVVHALNRLAATRTMEHHLRYISNIVVQATEAPLQPLYGLALEARLDEKEVASLAGYRGMGPVRIGNGAYVQLQNDIYGSAVLACAQSFFDERLVRPATTDLFQRLEMLGERAVASYAKPDAGLWELRNSSHIHTFSAVMCWAACDRLDRIATRLELADRARYWRGHAVKMHAEISERGWNSDLNSFVATFGGRDLDASLLLLHELGFLRADDPRFIGTVNAVERRLRRGDHLFRYDTPDDFGLPETAFNVCTFWFINALAAIGRTAEARELFEAMLASRNHLGLLSEDIDIRTGELWGNYPQTYSMVGLITSAMRLSRRWEDEF